MVLAAIARGAAGAARVAARGAAVAARGAARAVGAAGRAVAAGAANGFPVLTAGANLAANIVGAAGGAGPGAAGNAGNAGGTSSAGSATSTASAPNQQAAAQLQTNPLQPVPSQLSSAGPSDMVMTLTQMIIDLLGMMTRMTTR